MLTYRATLDVPHETLACVSGWIQAHRRRVDVRPWQRAATSWTQAMLALRWLVEDTDVDLLARDARVSQATAYRYLHEALDVIAARAPDLLPDVLAGGREDGWAFVALDGTLIETSRSAARSEAGHDVWFSGKHKRHGGNIQVLTDPTGYPVWTSPVEPGSTHDITAARAHALPFLYPAAAAGLPTLTDKGYTGAGIGIHVPTKGRRPGVDNHARNLPISSLRAPAERGNALLGRVAGGPWASGSHRTVRDSLPSHGSSHSCGRDLRGHRPVRERAGVGLHETFPPRERGPGPRQPSELVAGPPHQVGVDAA